MGHIDDPRSRRAAFLDTLRTVGQVVHRLPYGVPEPMLDGAAAMSLYTFGLWPCAELELSVTDPVRLTAALTAEGFLHDENTRHGERKLTRPDLRCAVRISADSLGLRRAIATNVVRVAFDHNPTAMSCTSPSSLSVIGIEDLVADQLAERRGQGGWLCEAAVCIQVLAELGQMGVGGPFRPAYLQRRVSRETNGEAVFELSHTASPLDDLSPRHTTLTAIANVVRRWRGLRGLFIEADENVFADAPYTSPGDVDRYRNDREERGEQSPALGARIIPFPMNRPHPSRNSGG
jgi:hypothetical protein